MIMTADRIKSLREQKGLTQSELAGMFNISTDYLLCVDKTATVGVEDLTEREKNG